jgi:hypothetical protein
MSGINPFRAALMSPALARVISSVKVPIYAPVSTIQSKAPADNRRMVYSKPEKRRQTPGEGANGTPTP